MNPELTSLGAPPQGHSPRLPLASEPSVERRQHIALVCDWYAPRIGGIERHLGQLAERLIAAGHRVTVVTPMRGAATETEAVRLHRVAAPLLPGCGLIWKPESFRRIGEILRTGRFDVIHVHHSLVSPAGFAALYHAQRAGIPAVGTAHSILGRYVWAFRALDRAFHWSRWPVVFSAVSERVAREIRPFVRSRPVVVLPNAIDPAEWRVAARAPSPTVTFATVMRLVPRKRGAALLHAFRQVHAAMPPGRVRLRLAGDGPERRRLQRLARRLGIAGAVEFLGAIPSAEVKPLLANAEIFVLASKLEAFGIAALEARAAGLPVAALRENGVAEFIEHGVDGLLANSDAELAANLVRLARDTALRERLQAHNRSVPVACTWDTVLAKHLDTYERAVALARQTKRSGAHQVSSTENGNRFSCAG